MRVIVVRRLESHLKAAAQSALMTSYRYDSITSTIFCRHSGLEASPEMNVGVETRLPLASRFLRGQGRKSRSPNAIRNARIVDRYSFRMDFPMTGIATGYVSGDNTL